MSIESILLYCLKQLNGERTIFSIYHLLNGKKSSQTIQDAHLYSLKRFFRIFEHLPREAFEGMIRKISEKNLVSDCGDQRFLPSHAGEVFLNNNPTPSYLNGWKYHPQSIPFWERLSLLVQVTSNLVYQEQRYVPIHKNKQIHIWLKSVLKESNQTRAEMGKNLLSEMINCLEKDKLIDPSVLVFRLTGYQRIGLTSMQIAKNLNLDVFNYQVEFLNILHFLIQTIEMNTNRFPLLSTLLSEFQHNNSLTQSARKTWELLKQGISIDEIVNIRQLKLSTIEDHLVEFALNMNDFLIEDYVDLDMQTKILDISREAKTRQLKIIRNCIKTATYFQIRLVLAKHGESQWN